MPHSPFIPAWPDLAPYVAELWLVVAVVATLLTPFFVRRPNSAVATVAVVGLLGAIVSFAILWPVDAVSGRFTSLLASDGLAVLWKLILLVFTVGVTLLWFSSGQRETREGEGPEFFVLLLCATLGMALMGSASNLLMIFLAVELASLPSYVLAGFRKTGRLGAEASLKYVLFGAAASSVMVWGLSLIYGAAGTLNLYGSSGTDGSHFAGIVERLSAAPQTSTLLMIGLLAMLVGIAFKIAAVPFHLWCPDVFEGASVDVTAFLSVASKGAGLVLLLRVTSAFSGMASTSIPATLASVIAVMGVLSMTVGNTAAYAQTHLKRLLAYSSIAHAGYMLCAVAIAAGGSIASGGSVSAGSSATQTLLFYLSVYLFMNLGAFAVVAAVERQTGEETLAGFAGLGRRSPLLAANLTLCLFSLIGVPPLAGFSAKFNVMVLLGSQGGWGWILVAAIGVNTVLSVFYYLKIIRAMYLRDTGLPNLPGNGLAGGLSVLCGIALVALFVGSSALSKLTGGYSLPGKSQTIRTHAPTLPSYAVSRDH